MKTVTDKSYGVVPVIKKNGDWQVLLIHQISYRGTDDRFWTFPKGHPDEGENPVETAERELMEETNVDGVQIVEEAQFPIQYSFTHEGKTIDKTVIYFLGICQNTQTKISLPEEIADLSWFSFKDASEKLTHKNTQKVLLEVGQYLNENLKLI